MTATAIDRLYQSAYALLYPLAYAWDRHVGKPGPGAGVALWHDGELLVVRHSYRYGWSLPGGRLRRGETPRQAAVRELREEVGIVVDPEALGPAIRLTRQERVLSLFEHRPLRRPAVTIDNREVVRADFTQPSGLANLSGDLRCYLGGVVPAAH